MRNALKILILAASCLILAACGRTPENNHITATYNPTAEATPQQLPTAYPTPTTEHHDPTTETPQQPPTEHPTSDNIPTPTPPPAITTITGQVLKIEGILTSTGNIPLYADFTKIHIIDPNGNPATIYTIGWSRNFMGTVAIGTISIGEEITAYFVEQSKIPIAIQGQTDGFYANIGWFSQLGDTNYAINSHDSFTFTVNENTAFVNDIPTMPSFINTPDNPWNISHYTNDLPLAVLYTSGQPAMAERVYLLNCHIESWLENLHTLLPPSLPLSDFQTIELPVYANNIQIEDLPTLAAPCGTILIPYTAATTLISYGVMRMFNEYGDMWLASSDGSGAGTLTLTLGSAEAVQFGGRRLPLTLPPTLINGVIYVPALSLFRGIMPFANGHILPSRIEVYQTERFSQGPHLFANYSPEEAVNMPVFVNGEPVDASLQIATDHYHFIPGQGTLYSSILMIELAPVLHALGYSYSQSDCGEGFYIQDELTNTIWISTYPVLGRLTRPITTDGRFYVPLFCLFRDWFMPTNVAVYDGAIYIKRLAEGHPVEMYPNL